MDNVVAIAAGHYQCLALKADGTIVAWGGGVPTVSSDVLAIATGETHSLALTSDGTVTVWGNYNTYGEGDVPTGLHGVISLAAGDSHSLALKSDGTVAAWGNNQFGQGAVPPGLRGVMSIAAGGHFSLALVAEPPTVVTAPTSQTTEVGSDILFRGLGSSRLPLTYQWFFNRSNAVMGLTTEGDLRLANVQLEQAGDYAFVAANLAGSVTSTPAMLSVIPPVPRRMVSALRFTGQAGYR